MDALTTIGILIIMLAILLLISMAKQARSISIGITIVILILSIVQIVVKWTSWGGAGFADYIMPVLCITLLLYYWKIGKG